jgi:hypothetical protein
MDAVCPFISGSGGTNRAHRIQCSLYPSLLELRVGSFYIALAGEKDRERVLRIIRQYLPNRVYVRLALHGTRTRLLKA